MKTKLRTLCAALSAAPVLLLMPAGFASTFEDTKVELETKRDESYAAYLTALNDAAPDLIMATNPETQTIDTLGQSVEAANLLTQLPFAGEDVDAAIGRAIGHAETLSELCQAEPEQGERCFKYLATARFLTSDGIVTDLLESATQDAPDLSATRSTFETLETELPDFIEVLTDEDLEPFLYTEAVENACGLTRAVTLISNKIDDDEMAGFEAQYRSVYAGLFDISNVPLCDDTGYSCRGAERCARSGTAGDCVRLKVERIKSICQPDGDAWEAALAARMNASQ